MTPDNGKKLLFWTHGSAILLTLCLFACRNEAPPPEDGTDWRALAVTQLAEIKRLEEENAELRATCAAGGSSPRKFSSSPSGRPASPPVGSTAAQAAAPPPAGNPLRVVALQAKSINDLGSTQRIAWSLQVANSSTQPVATAAAFELVDAQGFVLDRWEQSETLPPQQTVSGANVRLVAKNSATTITRLRVYLAAEGGAVQGECPVVPVPAPAPLPVPAARAPSSRASVYRSAGPRVALVTPDEILVDGALGNVGDQAATVSATLQLLRDGRVVQSTVLSLNVPAGGRAPYRHSFRSDGREGVFTVELAIN